MLSQNRKANKAWSYNLNTELIAKPILIALPNAENSLLLQKDLSVLNKCLLDT